MAHEIYSSLSFLPPVNNDLNSATNNGVTQEYTIVPHRCALFRKKSKTGNYL